MSTSLHVFSFSNPDSPVTESDFDDDEFDEEYFPVPPLRRQSLPTNSYRFSLNNNNATAA